MIHTSQFSPVLRAQSRSDHPGPRPQFLVGIHGCIDIAILDELLALRGELRYVVMRSVVTAAAILPFYFGATGRVFVNKIGYVILVFLPFLIHWWYPPIVVIVQLIIHIILLLAVV